jgi:KaiC/GvpD/RAD55 family RecA-like ATPase
MSHPVHEEMGEGWTDCVELAADPKALAPPPVVKSGFGAFDDAMPFGGVPHGGIVLWCGEMKAGKSRLVLALCAGCALNGTKCAYLMGEMSPQEHFERLLLMSLGLTTEELRDGTHAAERLQALEWIGSAIGSRLRFKAVPITLQSITKAAEWVGAGGVVAVDSIQRLRMAQRQSTRADEVEVAMDHIVAESKRTGAVFHVLSEIAQAPKDGVRNAHQWTKHSAAPRQNCDASYIVHKAEGLMQRAECLDMRRGTGRDFTVVLSERNGLPILPAWNGGAA